VSTVETDEGIKFSNTRRVLEDIGIRNPTYDDCAIVQHICRQVSKRAARLAGAGMFHFLLFHSLTPSIFFIKGLAVLINRIGKPNITVGVDGSLYRYHPRFKRNMERSMETLVQKDIAVFHARKIVLIISFFYFSSNWLCLMMVVVKVQRWLHVLPNEYFLNMIKTQLIMKK
jgi:hexokinase